MITLGSVIGNDHPTPLPVCHRPHRSPLVITRPESVVPVNPALNTGQLTADRSTHCGWAGGCGSTGAAARDTGREWPAVPHLHDGHAPTSGWLMEFLTAVADRLGAAPGAGDGVPSPLCRYPAPPPYQTPTERCSPACGGDPAPRPGQGRSRAVRETLIVSAAIGSAFGEVSRSCPDHVIIRSPSPQHSTESTMSAAFSGVAESRAHVVPSTPARASEPPSGW